MIVVGIVFVLCVYVAATISKVFNLSQKTVGALCMWAFLAAMGSIFYLLSLPHGY